MVYSAEVEHMCPLAKAAYHGPAPIPEEGNGFKLKKSKIFLVLHTVSVGVHHNRELVN